MEIIQAKAMGTCFGVQNAIEEAMSPEFSGNLTILGQLVHNPQVVKQLKENGVDMVDSIDDIDKIKTKNVMITAHGAADRLKETLREKGFTVFDASCPLVIRVHKALKKLVNEGYFPVVIGQANHVEVRGIVGDFNEYYIIEREEDIPGLKLFKKDKIGIVAQTTNQLSRTELLVEKIKKALPWAEVVFKNTVCKPTRDRQLAVQEITEFVDILIVVGGKNSSNTKKLLLVGNSKSIESYHVESEKELQVEWFKNKVLCGVTAGTSTPAEVIERVIAKIKEMTDSLSSDCCSAKLLAES